MVEIKGFFISKVQSRIGIEKVEGKEVFDDKSAFVLAIENKERLQKYHRSALRDRIKSGVKRSYINKIAGDADKIRKLTQMPC